MSTALLFLLLFYYNFIINILQNINTYKQKIFNKEQEIKYNKILLTAAHCMINRKHIQFISIDYDQQEVYECFKKSRSNFLPIYDKNLHIIGIYSLKNFMDDVIGNRALFSVLSNTLFVPENTNIVNIIKSFKKQINTLIVVDGFGSTVGIINRDSLIEAMISILGLHDKIEAINGVLYIDGQTFFEELDDVLHIKSFQTLSSLTIGGLISEFLGYIPQKGYKLSIDGHIFEILKANNMQVNRIKIITNYY